MTTMDKDFIMATAKTIEQQILWSINKWEYMSWGIKQKSAMEYEGMATLALRVSGAVHKGWVFISLNEGMDCYEVRLLNVARTKVKRTLDEVYCDNLGQVLDGLIERKAEWTDAQYKEKAVRDSARKMGMEVIDVSKKPAEPMVIDGVKYRPATLEEIDGCDIDLYMNGERVYVLMVCRSETIETGESKLDYITLTNMKKVQVEDLQVIDNDNEPNSSNNSETMASKIQGHNFYVAITPYKVQGVEDQYNELCVTTSYTQYQHQFYVSLHAGWKSTFGSHGCIIMGDQNPLTASTQVYVKESPKNSQKTINEMGAALELAKADIAWLFDQRMWKELKAFVKDVALCGYTYDMEQRIKGYKGATESDNNSSTNENSETMAQNVKAADLIGKTIVVGDNQATIVIKSVDGDKLSGEFTKDGKTTPMSFPVSQLHGMTEKGLWKLQTSDVSPQTSEVTTEADVQEVQDIVPVVTPKAKSDGGSKTADAPQTSDIRPQTSNQPVAIVKPMETKPKAEPKPKAKTQTSGKYVYATYQTKKGKTGAKITGFASEDDVFYAMAAEIHASGSYERDKQGNKHYYLCFGPRYAEAAKSICKVLNSDKTVNQKSQECKLIVSQATEELATKREEWKQKREERKAQTSAASPQSSEKCYTQSELAEWLRKLNSGTDKEKAAAAKFFNDLAKAA